MSSRYLLSLITITTNTLSNSSPFPSSLDGILSLRAQLQRTKNYLAFLHQTCVQEMQHLRIHSLHCGLDTLPDDLLLKIFEMAVEEHYRPFEGFGQANILPGLFFKLPQTQPGPEVSLSQVNPRFRTLALSSGMMWSYISNSLSDRWISERLKRSMNHKLTLELLAFADLPDYVSGAQRYLDQILPHSLRWRHFQLIREPNSDQDLEVVENELDGLVLPSLESIKVFTRCSNIIKYYQPNYSRWRRSEGHLGHSDDFIRRGIYLGSTWVMGGLKQISTSEVNFLSLIPSLSTITRVHLALTNHEVAYDIVDLEHLLLKLENVIELKLELATLDCFGHDAGKAEINLPKLDDLYVSCDGREILDFIMRKFRMPALKSLGVTTCSLVLKAIDENDWMKMITNRKRESVQSVSIRIEHPRVAPAKNLDVTDVLVSFPSLKEFIFETNYLSPIVAYDTLSKRNATVTIMRPHLESVPTRSASSYSMCIRRQSERSV